MTQELIMNKSYQRTAIHIVVHGYVQGVGFRYYTRTHAQRLGILGWVRNNLDGTVEIQAEGTRYNLEAFVNAVKRGPSHGAVQDLELSWENPSGEHHGFNITN